ncbi:MAG TPA: EamA family transporter [Actinomycetota bacterium]|nr:EamA family transporter [Actinomycetota bacterium]
MSGLGYVAVAGAALLWAVGGTTASYLASRGASVLELTQARAWIAVAGLGLVLALRRAERPSARPGWIILPFGLAIAAANVSYYLSVTLLPVAVAIVIQYTAPGLVVAWTALAQRRKPSRRVVVSLFVALTGVVALSGIASGVTGGDPLDPLGLAMAAVAAVSFAAYVVMGESVGRELGAERAVFWGFAVAGVFWLGVQASRGRPETLLDPAFIPWVLFLGVASTIAPFLLFLWALSRIEAARAGIVSTLEPLSAAAIAFVWLGQVLAPVQLVGAALVVAGVAVVQTERSSGPDALVERTAVE